MLINSYIILYIQGYDEAGYIYEVTDHAKTYFDLSSRVESFVSFVTVRQSPTLCRCCRSAFVEASQLQPLLLEVFRRSYQPRRTCIGPIARQDADARVNSSAFVKHIQEAGTEEIVHVRSSRKSCWPDYLAEIISAFRLRRESRIDNTGN
jgi:hypothetical protein